MLSSHVIKVSIDRTYDDVYEFLVDPLNFAKWAANPGSVMEPLDDLKWLVEVPGGKRIIRFTRRNEFGILDYEAFPMGQEGGPSTPVRLVRNGDGCELLLVWVQRPGVTDERFKSDVEWVASDLQRLKVLMEGG